ncbi:hydroxymethylglutaryl-CoA lyase [Bacillus sp. V3B]|uniref:hydroxymethylglutaryl-CoA lyase n=1 Tax=Bacillus sp. V3B TaxID=2804915 RepID=UPI002109AFF9|nr:hydroxymethylglutaryl-CoA lyase [Bacillus sp. V3B]MCQ6273799.1 hydroxymethylglutaryl-CoA lyase [Bacillus sp. V3B]
MTLHLPKEVTIIEVGPRDGLQNENNFIPTTVKIDFIKKLKNAGIREIELTSFVSPKWIPQMRDAVDIVSSCLDAKTRNIVLIPNRKGMERMRKTHACAIAVFIGVSNTFNVKNINKTTTDSMLELIPIIKELKEKDYFVRACISTAFYCPYEGKIEKEDTLKLCKQFADAGVDEFSVADTIGMAAPHESYSLFSKLIKTFPEILLTAHFHDTRKMALANILAALQAGVHRFDTSSGGLGGCPFAKGATGNVATEDVVFMLHQMGISTGINLEKLVQAIDTVQQHLSRPTDTAFYRLRSFTV